MKFNDISLHWYLDLVRVNMKVYFNLLLAFLIQPQTCLNGLMKVQKNKTLGLLNTNIWSKFLDSPHDFKNSSIFWE